MDSLHEPINREVRPRLSTEIADIKVTREIELRRTDPEQAFLARRADVLRRIKERDRYEPQLYSQCKPYYHKRGVRNCQKGGI